MAQNAALNLETVTAWTSGAYSMAGKTIAPARNYIARHYTPETPFQFVLLTAVAISAIQTVGLIFTGVVASALVSAGFTWVLWTAYEIVKDSLTNTRLKEAFEDFYEKFVATQEKLGEEVTKLEGVRSGIMEAAAQATAAGQEDQAEFLTQLAEKIDEQSALIDRFESAARQLKEQADRLEAANEKNEAWISRREALEAEAEAEAE